MSAKARASVQRAPAHGQSEAPSVNVLGANDRITVGMIGLGFGLGQNHLIGIHEASKENNIVVAAACDVFNKRRGFAMKKTNLRAADVYVDYRELLERKDLDAVVVCTHDPLHCGITLDALDAGKHVYCETPFTRYLGEAFRVYDRVKATGKMFQLGAQICSAGAWARCAQLVVGGKLGALVWSQGCYCRNGGPGCDGCSTLIEPESTADNIDWNKWLGPVGKRPFDAVHFHQWRLYREYSAGLLANQAGRQLHPLMLATGHPEFPTRVACCSVPGTLERFAVASGHRVPTHIQLMAEFPGGNQLTIICSWMNAKSPGFALYGHKATLFVGSSGQSIELVPEREYTGEIASENLQKLQPEDIRLHEKNWFDCIRSGKRPTADIELAIRAQTVLSLAEMSDRLKITCLFDQQTRRITNADGKVLDPLTYGSLD